MNELMTLMNTTEYSDSDMLQFVLQNGILNLDDVADAMRKKEIDEMLSNHPSPITQGTDGRWKTHVKTHDGRKLIAKKEYMDVVYALMSHYKGSTVSADSNSSAATLTSLYPQWIEFERQRGAADGTIKYKESTWKNHIAKAPFAGIPLSKIRKLDIERWAYDLIDTFEMNKKRFFNIGGVLRGLLNYAVDCEIISESPYKIRRDIIVRKCAPYECESSRIPVFSDQEEQMMFKTAWSCYRNGHHTVHVLIPLAIMFQFNTGLRLSELCALRDDDVNVSILTVRRMLKDSNHEVVPYTKNYKTHREVPLNDYALMLLDEVRKKKSELGVVTENGYIFSTDERPLSYTETKKAYTRYCEIAGIEPRSSHSARKTFITRLVDSGRFTIAEIARMCGNSEQVIWKHYYHAREDVSSKIGTLNEIFANAGYMSA